MHSGYALSTLVILGASITALAVARDAYKHQLCPVVIDSDDGPALHSRWVTPVHVKDTSSAATLDRVLSFSSPDAALIATADHWICFLMANRAKLDAAFQRVLHPDNATLDVCLDKAAFAQWCAASALPCPVTWSPGRQPRPASITFPLLVRPARTVHSRRLDLPKAVQARNESELTDWLQRFEAKGIVPLVSESLLGRALDQYSAPFARHNGRTLLFTARKVRPPAQLCQTGTCVEMCIDESIERLARAAIERLDYSGIGEVEILRDRQTGRDYLVEINARPWLQYALAPASKHDFLGLALGLPVATANVVRTGKTWINLHDDLFIAFSRSVGEVRHRRLGLLSYLQSLARGNVYAVFDPRDLRPFLSSLRQR